MHEHKDCCHHDHSHGHKHAGGGTAIKTSAQATLHCLTGCVIGEVAGLLIGVHFALGMWPTMILATILAYIVGFGLSVGPIMRREGLSLKAALRVVWLGEAISIGVMEIVMNLVDYTVGGVQSGSVFSAVFWIGIAAAIPAGFLAAWPVNHWLLKHELKKCH